MKKEEIVISYRYAVTCDNCGSYCSRFYDSYGDAVKNTFTGTIHNGHFSHFCSDSCFKKNSK